MQKPSTHFGFMHQNKFEDTYCDLEVHKGMHVTNNKKYVTCQKCLKGLSFKRTKIYENK